MKSPHLNENHQIIANLQTQARNILNTIIPNNAHIILVDYPHHPNVGDSLIWLGEIAYLKSKGLKPSYVCDYKNYNPNAIRKILNKNSIILIHGGGNFGDIWEHLHNFKLQVLQDFPLIKVIQMPQSIYFENNQNVVKTADAIKKHGNFTLLVRSHESLAIAQKNFESNNMLCPDMAFFIGPITAKKLPVFDCFVLSRTDAEKSIKLDIRTAQLSESHTSQLDDWLAVSNTEYQISRLETHHLFRKWFEVIDPNNHILLMMWTMLSKARLKRGVSLLSQGSVVITDRLHAHILSILINKPHVIIDNSYGKLGDFYRCWTLDYSLGLYVKDLDLLQKTTADLVDFMTQLNHKTDTKTAPKTAPKHQKQAAH